jgi:hypothetical protein
MALQCICSGCPLPLRPMACAMRTNTTTPRWNVAVGMVEVVLVVGDKAQLIASVATLLQYALAALCIISVDATSSMSIAIESSIVLVSLSSVILPFVYMYTQH